MIRRFGNYIALLGLVFGMIGSPIVHELTHALDISQHEEESKALGHLHGTGSSDYFSIGVVLSHLGDLNCTICNPVTSKEYPRDRIIDAQPVSTIIGDVVRPIVRSKPTYSFVVRGPPVSA
jgi:hypothetical protein